MKIYISYCPKCKNKSLHRIIRVSRKRGVKLMCLKCLQEHPNYCKIEFLKQSEGGVEWRKN